MTDATNSILRQALELEPDESAILAAELLASLEASEDDVQRAWAAEIERRSLDAALERGEDWRVVLDEIRVGVLQRWSRYSFSPPRGKSFANRAPGIASGIPRSLIGSFTKCRAPLN